MYVAKYKDLIGTEFKMKLHRRGISQIFDAYLAQIDFKVGITVKYIEPNMSVLNKENNAYCLNRKTYKSDVYRNEFNKMVTIIRKGEIYTFEMPRYNKMTICAFK